MVLGFSRGVFGVLRAVQAVRLSQGLRAYFRNVERDGCLLGYEVVASRHYLYAVLESGARSVKVRAKLNRRNQKSHARAWPSAESTQACLHTNTRAGRVPPRSTPGDRRQGQSQPPGHKS